MVVGGSRYRPAQCSVSRGDTTPRSRTGESKTQSLSQTTSLSTTLTFVMTDVEYNKYLPLYRSLLTPNAQYDYRTHLVVQLSLLDLKNIISRFKLKQSPPSKMKMKYNSLLSDVSRKALILSIKVQSSLHSHLPTPQTLKATHALWNRCKTFSQLPIEIQVYVFELVDDPAAYRNCLRTSRRFYQLSKPFLYRHVLFTSTYRFAQFITCLRLNASLGAYVLSVDLSQLKPGNWELKVADEELEEQDRENDDLFQNPANIMAGWRDWKFRNNPLYALHPAPAIPLIKVLSNSSVHPGSTKKTKLTKMFKKRRRSAGSLQFLHTINLLDHHTALVHAPSHVTSHPTTNKFLMNYSNSKDVPIGHILHLINICTNLESLDFAHLSLSSDYRIVQPMAHKYQSFDVMHNHHKDMMKVIDGIAPVAIQSAASPFTMELQGVKSKNSGFELTSSASSVFSLGSLTKPVRKYNSLLPPLSASISDLLYLAKGDGRLYLSDLNLRAINNAHLEVVNETEVLRSLSERSGQLKVLNLSSMISINLKIIKEFLIKMLESDLTHKTFFNKDYLLFCGKHFEVGAADDEVCFDTELKRRQSGLKVLDLTDSGMCKNLQWAQKIDTETMEGQKLIHRIINDEMISSFEEFVIRERIRRGRVGENYFS